MKSVRITAVIIIAGAVAIAAIIAVFALTGTTTSLPAQGSLAGKTFSAGNFSVTVVQDSGSRFLANVENKGPTLEHAAAFAVKNHLNQDCEPQGIVVANFQLSQKQDGKLVPSQDSLPSGSITKIDSQQANLNNNLPVGDDLKTSIYILRLYPDSVRAVDLVQRIDLQTGASSAATAGQTDLQAFENCIQKSGKGYPLLLHLQNLAKGSQTFFTVTDGASGNRYETALKTSLQGDVPKELFWPPSRGGWLAGNFTQNNGPAPAWPEKPGALTLTVKTIDPAGHVHESAKTVQLDGLHESSLDFVEVAKGNAVPIYPKYWEISVNLS